MRPRCSAFIATSLDGCIARRDGSLDWLDTVGRPGEDYGYGTFLADVDAIIFGRRTYETALSFPEWPYAGKRCVVLTHGSPAPRHGEQFHAGDPRPLLETLAAEGLRHVYVDGGEVIRAFLAAGLVDDVTLSIVPVWLGDGVRLFAPSGREQPLELVRAQAYPSGLVQLTYRVRSGPPG